MLSLALNKASFSIPAAMLLALPWGLVSLRAAPPQFHVNKNLYSETADPAADIASAEKAARPGHKHILLDFGGNWCGDCQVLDFYYQQPPNAEVLAKYYVVVHVDIGHMDHNVGIAEKYHVPIKRGVPALAVLDAGGHLLYAEQEKEFEHTSPEALHAFLDRWK